MNKCICINPPNKYFEKGKIYDWEYIIDGMIVYLNSGHEQYFSFGDIQWYWYFKQ